MDGSVDDQNDDSGLMVTGGGKRRGKRSRGSNRDVLTQIDENATRNDSNNNHNHTTGRNSSSSSKRHRNDQDHASVQVVTSSSSHGHNADDEGTQNLFSCLSCDFCLLPNLK